MQKILKKIICKKYNFLNSRHLTLNEMILSKIQEIFATKLKNLLCTVHLICTVVHAIY